MKGKTLLVTGLAAIVLAACGGGKALPTPTSTPNLGAPYSCVEPGKSPIAHLGQGVSFDVGSVVNQVFSYSEGFVCDKVLNIGSYTVVIGNETARGFFSSIAYVFKSFQQSPYNISFIGVAPNEGEHKHVVVAENAGLGDLLILNSQIKSLEGENGQMLNTNAEKLGFWSPSGNHFNDWHNRSLHYGSKIVVYKLDGSKPPQPYNPNVKPQVVTLEKIAARPVYFGTDVEVDRMELVKQQGKPTLRLTVSEIRPDGNRYTIVEGNVAIEDLLPPKVRTGIITDIPVFKAPNM